MHMATNTAPRTDDSTKSTEKVQLQWKKCEDMPVQRYRGQAIVIDNKVYVGGIGDDELSVLEYNPIEDDWTRLPNHVVLFFGLCQFQGELVTVGGVSTAGPITNEVYRYSTADGKWVEFLKPMLTKRLYIALLTTASAIIVCGGTTTGEDGPLATVEVYSSTTSQWHTANPLPQPCYLMSSVVIGGSGYLLGGSGASLDLITSVFSVDVAMLVDRATSSTGHRDATSTWKILPDTPLRGPTADTLSGRLFAVGGRSEDDSAKSAIYVFIPSTNSWVPSGNMPVERSWTAAAQLSNNQLIVLGGLGKSSSTSTCYIGTEDV